MGKNPFLEHNQCSQCTPFIKHQICLRGIAFPASIQTLGETAEYMMNLHGRFVGQFNCSVGHYGVVQCNQSLENKVSVVWAAQGAVGLAGRLAGLLLWLSKDSQAGRGGISWCKLSTQPSPLCRHGGSHWSSSRLDP